jgi:zinc protease
VTQTPPWPSELAARYEFLEEAGRGGMGVVYKARDRETGELVAIKVLRPEVAADRLAADRFINEVRLSRRITHKNVCRVYEFTRAGSVAYLSMEYVEGESLRSVLSRVGAVKTRKGVQIARQICAALGEAHAQGIIHRDLKPENVMLDRSGNVKVMDFGIARLLDSAATSTGGVMGTPAYMAPEQAESRPLDPRTDIYALGLILYELLTGQTAFTGDTPVAVALKQVRETPPAPRTIEPSLPPEVDEIVMRCLEKDPARRYQSVAELDGALARVSEGSPAPAATEPTPVSQWSGVVKAETKLQPGTHRSTSRRKTILAAAGLAAVAVLAAVAYLTLWRTDDEIPFTAFRLGNGLRVLISEDRSAPTVSVVVTYTVGSRDERQGRRGFAHLFEHVMFSGSLNVGKGEHVALVAGYGGVANGQALYDLTQYGQTLPAHQLDLALFLEADRMRSLKLDQARLDVERATVLVEIAQRKDNQAYGRVDDTLFGRAYDAVGYKRDVLGSAEDIRSATLEDVADFFKIYYAPNNAVLTIIGDVDAGDVKARVLKLFEHIPAQPPPPAPDLSEPVQTEERRLTLEDPFAPAARLYIAYKGPPGTSADWDALHALVNVVANSNSSRLNQKLVRESGAATQAYANWDRRAGPGHITFVVVPSADRDRNAVLTQFDAVLAEAAEKGISDADLTRAKRRIDLGRANSLQSTRERAATLGDAESRFGDAAAINRRAARLAAITVADVQRVAREYLKRERRTILEVVPAAAKGAPVQPLTSSGASVASERLNRAPVSKEVLRVSLPQSKDFTLDNGLAVQIVETERVPLVTARFDIRGAGPLNDPPEHPGLAFMTGIMLRNGAADRSSRDISEQLDLFGVSISAGTSGDPASIFFMVTGLSETFSQWFPLAVDLLTKPSFPGDELTVAKRSFASQMAARRASPNAAASDLMVSVMVGSEAPIVPAPETLLRLSADRLVSWHRERYVPQNAVLSIVGDVDRDEAERIVRALLSGWARTSFADPTPPFRVPATRVVHVLDRPGSVQTAVMLGGMAPTRADGDYPAVLLGSIVLGTPSGRLMRELREARGWSYNPQAGLLTTKHGGVWLTYGDVSSSRTGEALTVFVDELRKIATEPVSAAELDDAKRSVIGGFALNLESLGAVAANMSMRRVEGLSADYWQRFPDIVQAVTAEDVRRVAAKYIDLSKAQITAVGERDQLVPQLKPFGPITFYDQDGRPIAENVGNTRPTSPRR